MVTLALLVQLDAQRLREQDPANFIRESLSLVAEEPAKSAAAVPSRALVHVEEHSRTKSLLNRSPNSDRIPQPSTSALEAGTLAPDFSLHTTPDQLISLHELRGAPVILTFYPLTGARCAAISWRFTTSSCRSFSASMHPLSVSQSMVSGAISPIARIANSGSRCWRTSSRKGKSRAVTASIARMTASPNGRFS